MANPLFRRKPIQRILDEMAGDSRLHRVLGPVSLSSLGVGAIIGTGIFVLTGVAAHDKAGPAVMLSYAFAGVACIFAALCYAEFAAMVPVAGSAYTYAYATLGELAAWIIGWDLVLEYAVASATVAHGWSHYFQNLIGIFGMQLPEALRTGPFDYDPSTGELAATGSLVDLPAVLVAGFVTVVLVKGIKESVSFNNVMVAVKLGIVLFVIFVGMQHIDTANWTPFAPFGYSGVSILGHVYGQTGPGGQPLGMMAGAATIFFAYIGFDSVSTHAEEAKNPQRDVPIGIIVSLVLCTLLYIAVSAVITGMVPYDQIDIDAPIPAAFASIGMPWAQLLIAAGALAGITSVLLVLMLSQPRVMLAMARDGLVPRGFFAAVHEKFRTPWKSSILTGVFVALLAGLLPLRVLAELVNIGTLFAFVVVCVAVLVLRRTHPELPRPFRCPWVPLVPLLGVLMCIFLMLSLPAENWLRLVGWLAIGLAIYFGYSAKHSVLRNEPGHPRAGR
ncbi:MAG: amino acid permease [Myxococcales bacterium]|nr:amino acid permease [Myxococcales bacterium]MCB9627994.1 amino acid permease [Sandaracinaceae bacterium]